VILITVELIPGGYENHPRRQVLGTAKIANIGGTDTLGDYRAVFTDKAGRELWRTQFGKFPRMRLLAWDLLFRALRATPVGERNKEV
jgi:hypothetical protein